jgi:hypothetical protein
MAAFLMRRMGSTGHRADGVAHYRALGGTPSLERLVLGRPAGAVCNRRRSLRYPSPATAPDAVPWPGRAPWCCGRQSQHLGTPQRRTRLEGSATSPPVQRHAGTVSANATFATMTTRMFSGRRMPRRMPASHDPVERPWRADLLGLLAGCATNVRHACGRLTKPTHAQALPGPAVPANRHLTDAALCLLCLASRSDRCWSDRKRSNYISRMASSHPSVPSPPVRARLPPVCLPSRSDHWGYDCKRNNYLLGEPLCSRAYVTGQRVKKGTQPCPCCEAVSNFRKPLWHSLSHGVATRFSAQLPWAGGRKCRGCDEKLPPATQSPGRLRVLFNVTGTNKLGHHLVDAAFTGLPLH